MPPRISLICGRLASGSEAEQGLERGHGLPAPIVAKDEFIKVNLELIAAHAVIGSDQPLLEIADGAVCQRQHRLSRLCADRFARVGCEAHAGIRLPAAPQSSTGAAWGAMYSALQTSLMNALDDLSVF